MEPVPSGSLDAAARPQTLLPFEVINLDVTVQEDVRIRWQGRDIDSGRVTIKLGRPGSAGTINYETGMVDVEFRVKIHFEELAEILNDMGAPPEITAPIDAVIRSQGRVFDADHALRLSGKGELGEHRLFNREETRIDIRAPSQ